MRLLDDKRTLHDACRMVSAARRHLGIAARLIRCPAGEDDQIEIGPYAVIPEDSNPTRCLVWAKDGDTRSKILWELSVAVPIPATRWDPPDADVVELGSFSSWTAALGEIAAIEARENLDNLLEWDGEREYRAQEEREERRARR